MTNYNTQDIELLLPDMSRVFNEAMNDKTPIHGLISVLGVELLAIYINPAAAERMLADDPELADRLNTVAVCMSQLLDLSKSPLLATAYRAMANYIDDKNHE